METTLYRIHIEDALGKDGQTTVDDIAAQHFEAFTVLRGDGYWRGDHEKAVVIEVYTDYGDIVESFARAAREEFRQECVLVARIHTENTLVERS